SVASYHDNQQLPIKCVSVRCQGYENSLAECVISDKKKEQCQFKCVNRKCVSLKCRNKAFRCRTGVCLHKEAVGDGQVDCLDGEDESERHTSTDQTKATRVLMESRLTCGVPNTNVPDDDDDDGDETVQGLGSRVKRVVGGLPTRPTQIQWQVALENRRFQCRGAYIGSCWVLTAAHCFKTDWGKRRKQYNPTTRENDIALVKLRKLPYSDACFTDNSVINPVCVPWTTRLSQPNHTCTISGWGETGGTTASWAKVSLIEDCQRFRKGRLKPGMICAVDLDGSVGACQGDNRGPLVCEDELGVSCLWGIISWGNRCGQRGSPGVYTQVAHYFEWIRFHTGWTAVTKFNS
uniref:trypsin n=1 Tax=Mola mola TaxID=94237 RepID=A0A3Q3WD86_MOLML